MNVKKDRIEKEYHITSFLKSEPVAIRTITLLFILLLQLSALFSNAPANIFTTNPSIELSTTPVIIIESRIFLKTNIESLPTIEFPFIRMNQRK